MKIFKFLAVALVAMLGFTACDKETEYIYDDHSADLVGTWSCLTENYAEVLIINADGSAVSYGVENGEYWENVRGTITVKENNITMIFEDDDNFSGHFDIIPGMAFSLFEDSGERYIYQYCAKDLADEIVGMWVCTDAPTEDGEAMIIHTFMDNGKAIYTGFGTYVDEYLVNKEATYKVVGDLLFYALPQDNLEEGAPSYITKKLTYKPNGVAYGDIMEEKVMMSDIELTSTMLRIKQHLELAGNAYDYIKTFVTNVKGEDKDIPFLNTSFNFAKMDGSIIDKFLKSILFTVEFPEANKIKYSYLLEGKNIVIDAPIEVDGNKMTIKMSSLVPVMRDIDVYTFQDKYDTQLHMYMSTKCFIDFFGNLSLMLMAQKGEINIEDAAAVEAWFQGVEDVVESINLSFVMTKSK